MTLAEYLKIENLKPSDFAVTLGLTTEAVRLYLIGRTRPGPRTMRKIMAVTGGKVEPNDFYPAPAEANGRKRGRAA